MRQDLRAMRNIQKSKTTHSGGYSANSVQNPYSMNVGGKDEDISWLL